MKFNKSFKPNLIHYSTVVAEKDCAGRLTQALDVRRELWES